jgi:DNA-binding response OmpR family regulator
LPRLLLAESEDQLRTKLAYLLEGAGLETITATSGPEALALFEASTPDVLLLDLDLPGMSGLEVCRHIRDRSHVPILLLSEGSDESTVVAGLDLGADDCIAKPIRIRELLARTSAALRRPQLRRAPSLPRGKSALTSGDLEVDLGAGTAARDGRPLSLKPRTLALLGHFMQHPQTVFARDELLRRLWPAATRRHSRTVDVHVLWIRQQIEDDPGNPRRLRTLRKKGYRFEG